ncbi:hypothetical protein J6590_031119 [Homalodisca vitripennis]|nr:hypothetical protein J6590_031119 [Homalodisca vitripennis]
MEWAPRGILRSEGYEISKTKAENICVWTSLVPATNRFVISGTIKKNAGECHPRPLDPRQQSLYIHVPETMSFTTPLSSHRYPPPTKPERSRKRRVVGFGSRSRKVVYFSQWKNLNKHHKTYLAHGLP